MSRTLAALLALLLVMCSAADASAQVFRGLNISVDPPSGSSTYGYAVYRFFITNPGESDRTVRISLDLADDDAWREISGSAAVPAGSTVELPIYQPPVGMQAYSARVFVDGAIVNERIRMPLASHGVEQYTDSYGYYWSRDYPPSHIVLVSSGVPSEISSRVELHLSDPTASSSGYYGQEETREIDQASRATSSWPEDWLGYSRYLAIVMMVSEFESLPNPVREAVLGSVHAGGNLLLLDGESPLTGGLGAITQSHGLEWSEPEVPGWVSRSASSDPPNPWQAESDFGFGSIQWGSRWHVRSVSVLPGNTMFDRWQRAIEPRTKVHTLEDAEQSMSVVGELTVPRRMTFIFLVIFAALVCPVNLIVLSRSNRRTLLFVTAPLLGLLFSATVFVYGILHDGISSTARIEAVSVLDQRTRLCSTSTQLGFYAPLTPRGGLSFSNDTEVTPMLGSRGQRLSRSQRVTLFHGEQQQLQSGWISPREPAHFWTRSHSQRRERVVVQRDDQGEWTATNGLGVPITTFTFHDGDGEMYAAKDMEPGQQVVLQPTPLPGSGGSKRIASLMSSSLPSQMTSRLAGSLGVYNRPWSYTAVVEGRLFAQQGIESVGKLNAREVVIGLVDPQEAMP